MKSKQCILIDSETGETFKFDTTANASLFIGRNSHYVSNAFYNGGKIVDEEGRKYDAIVGGVHSSEINPKNKSLRGAKQLCFSCKKACGGCSWSTWFRPVQGWKAVPTKIRQGYQTVESFHIMDCPEYKEG